MILHNMKALSTIHMYRSLVEAVQSFVAPNEFFVDVLDYCIHIGFQGRGALHIHVCAWVVFHAGDIDHITGHSDLVGRTVPGRPHCTSSRLVKHLEEMFAGRVDVQCVRGVDVACLNYVCGYASKASDCFTVKSSEYKSAGLLEKMAHRVSVADEAGAAFPGDGGGSLPFAADGIQLSGCTFVCARAALRGAGRWEVSH